MAPTNLHATAIVAGECGILVTGRSGAGKSALAVTVVDMARARGHFAALVSDDQVWLEQRNGRLVAEAPDPIAGLLELRGYGPAPMAFERRAIVDRLVTLVDPASAPRYRDGACETVLGISLPRLALPERNAEASARAIVAWLAGAPE